MRRFVVVVLVCLVIFAGLLWFFFEKDMATLDARFAGRSEIIQTPFGPTEYATTGKGQAVLAIHGTGGGFDQTLEMMGPLVPYGYRLITPSRFGYLRTAFPPDATQEMQADAFIPLLDHLGLKDVIVLGGSAGALSAMQFAIRHPERCRALVLLVPAAYAPDRPAGTSGAEGPIGIALMRAVLRADFIFWLVAKVRPDTMATLLLATPPERIHAADLDEQDRVHRVLMHILPISRRAEGLMLDARTAGAPGPYQLDQIKCPVLAISSRDDLFVTNLSAAYIAAKVPDGKLILYPNGGHILVGRDRQVWRDVADFLKPFGQPGGAPPP